jgi:hypothetical protein
MIIIQLIGGLGNQMFQYAAAKALSLETKQKLRLNTNLFNTYKIQNYGLHNFEIKHGIYQKPNKFIQKFNSVFYKKVFYQEVDFTFTPDFCKLKGNPIVLDGFFESEKYFVKYREQLLIDFTIKSPLKDITKKTAQKMAGENSVSIHIRRGDYLQHTIHNTNKTEYYKMAIETIKNKVENPVFYLFSDDMAWVKQFFILKGEKNYIDFNDNKTNYEDMKLMSSCKHNIIANSSFSWWSAWLNTNPKKIVIAPKKWLNMDEKRYEEIIPDAWIKF